MGVRRVVMPCAGADFKSTQKAEKAITRSVSRKIKKTGQNRFCMLYSFREEWKRRRF